MNAQIEWIMKQHDPATKELRKWDETVAKHIKIIFIALYISSFIVGLIVASLATEDLSAYHDLTVNVFGMTFEIDGDSFWTSFFVIAMGVNLTIDIVITILLWIVVFVFQNIGIKCQMLDNTYRTTLLTAKLLEAQIGADKTNSATVPDSETATPNVGYAVKNQPAVDLSKEYSVPVKLFKKGNGKVFCPQCGTEQNDDRYRCFNCGVTFVNQQPGIPYWCGECGVPGPYEGNCPKCNSDHKIFNA